MKELFYLFPATILAILVWIIYASYKEMQAVVQMEAFKGCKTFHDLIEVVKNNPTDENIEIVQRVRKNRLKRIGIWFISIIATLLILFLILTSRS